MLFFERALFAYWKITCISFLDSRGRNASISDFVGRVSGCRLFDDIPLPALGRPLPSANPTNRGRRNAFQPTGLLFLQVCRAPAAGSSVCCVAGALFCAVLVLGIEAGRIFFQRYLDPHPLSGV